MLKHCHRFASVHKADKEELWFVGQMRSVTLLINLVFNSVKSHYYVGAKYKIQQAMSFYKLASHDELSVAC